MVFLSQAKQIKQFSLNKKGQTFYFPDNLQKGQKHHLIKEP